MSDLVASDSKCIYCGVSSDYTDEHVFPAGLGGDDKKYILRSGVCSNCNTTVFSKFEATLMRRSVIALARAIHHPRNRENKDSRFDPIETKILDGDGRQLESGYKSGFNPEVYPQIIYNGESIDSAAPDKRSLQSFIGDLASLLSSDCIILVEKRSGSTRNKFIIYNYKLTGSAFMLMNKEGALKPPKRCLWIQFQSSRSNTDECASPIVFQRPGKQLVIKLKSLVDVGVMLFKIKCTLPSILQESFDAECSEHATPLVRTTSLGWSTDCDRAIAKLGVNFIAFQEGLHASRNRSLDEVKRFILGGSSKRRVSFITDEAYKANMFGVVPEGHHCVALSTSHNLDGTLSAMLSVIFYGNTCLVVNLGAAEFKRDRLEIRYYMIDYRSNKIRAEDVVGYHRSYNPDFSRMLSTIFY